MIDKQREFLLHWQCLGVLKRLPMKRLNTVNKLGYFGVFWLLVFIMMG